MVLEQHLLLRYLPFPQTTVWAICQFILSTDAPDTPQTSLSPLQQSLSLGGLTVNTALAPPDKTKLMKVSADTNGNLDTTLGFFISNIFHLDFSRSETQDVPQTTDLARLVGDSAINLRGSGKAILTSPLRGAPIWSALSISLGRNMNAANNTLNGYLFAETPLTWEASPKIAININPKVGWEGEGTTLWGIGLGANIQIAPRLELIPEANIILGSQPTSNGTLGSLERLRQYCN